MTMLPDPSVADGVKLPDVILPVLSNVAVLVLVACADSIVTEPFAVPSKLLVAVLIVPTLTAGLLEAAACPANIVTFPPLPLVLEAVIEPCLVGNNT